MVFHVSQFYSILSLFKCCSFSIFQLIDNLHCLNYSLQVCIECLPKLRSRNTVLIQYSFYLYVIFWDEIFLSLQMDFRQPITFWLTVFFTIFHYNCSYSFFISDRYFQKFVLWFCWPQIGQIYNIRVYDHVIDCMISRFEAKPHSCCQSTPLLDFFRCN